MQLKFLKWIFRCFIVFYQVSTIAETLRCCSYMSYILA